MRFSDEKRNWGCLTSILLAALILPPLFGLLMMGGGGCEGRAQPCEGDYGLAWLIMGAAFVALIILSWLINRVIALFRRTRP